MRPKGNDTMRILPLVGLLVLAAVLILQANPSPQQQTGGSDSLPDISTLKWEVIERQTSNFNIEGRSLGYLRTMERAKVFGGWLVRSTLSDHYAIEKFGVAQGTGSGLTFVPDPSHQWRLE